MLNVAVPPLLPRNRAPPALPAAPALLPVNVECVIVSEPSASNSTAPPASPQTLFEKVLWEIVTSPDGAQLRPPPLLRPAHPFPEMTTAERSRLSLGPPPRIAPPPNAWANPPEIVTSESVTLTPPRTLGSSSNTRAVLWV